MKKFLFALSLLAVSFTGTAHAASGKDALAKLAPPGGASTQAITGSAYFGGMLRVARTNCSDVRIGQAMNSGFRFTGFGNTGVAQFSGITYRGAIRGSVFNGRGAARGARGQMAAGFTGAGGRVSGARVAIVLQAASGCAVGLTGNFRVR
jgi:hypothetical protein